MLAWFVPILTPDFHNVCMSNDSMNINSPHLHVPFYLFIFHMVFCIKNVQSLYTETLSLRLILQLHSCLFLKDNPEINTKEDFEICFGLILILQQMDAIKNFT